MNNQRNIIVIGGGAAGMIAAIAAAKEGCAVSLYEKNEKLGKKIFITGKGRCNVTNAGDMDELFGAVITNKKFMFSSFYGFTNEDMMQFLEDAGLHLKIERGKRVFPVSDHSSDVIAALERTLKKENVKVHFRKEVKGLNLVTEDDKTICKGIFLEENGKKTAIAADCVIVAQKCRESISKAEIAQHMLILPDEESGTELETDINSYGGDIFRTNFREKALNTAGFGLDEMNYYLGIKKPDTFSQYYCDYTNDYVQLMMARKLDRWQNKYFSKLFTEQKKTDMMAVRGEMDFTGIYEGVSGSIMERHALDQEPEIEVENRNGFKIIASSYALR